MNTNDKTQAPDMTPEESASRAVVCTASGALSLLAKWEFSPGQRLTSHPGRIVAVKRSRHGVRLAVLTDDALRSPHPRARVGANGKPMKSADIAAILDVNPDARFAQVPSDHETKVRYLADLAPLDRGRWSAKHAGTTQRLHLSARVICPAEDAEAKVAQNVEQNARNYVRRRRAEQVAADLTRAGVPAPASGGRIIVDSADVEALAGLVADALRQKRGQEPLRTGFGGDAVEPLPSDSR